MKNNKLECKTIWIAWERHRRTVELCKHFKFTLFAFVSNRNRVIKHTYFCCKTVYTLIKYRPQTLIVQNPSVVLTFIACVLKRVFGYSLIVDTHNGGILPENKILQKLPFIFKYFQRKACFSIVTNVQLAKKIANNNGLSFVLPDKIPDFYVVRSKEMSKDIISVVCICTYGIDEPYEELLKSIGDFDNSIRFYVTGNIGNLAKNGFNYKAENVVFTGFLPEADYWKLLCSADLIVDLTKREDCLVCGAYEALAVEVPMLLSDTAALRNYFFKGAVFSKNTAEDLSRNILYAVSNIETLKKEVLEAKTELKNMWVEKAAEFMLAVEKNRKYRFEK